MMLRRAKLVDAMPRASGMPLAHRQDCLNSDRLPVSLDGPRPDAGPTVRGGQQCALGPGRIDEPIVAPEPDFTLGQQTTDEVRQLTVGLGYEARWRGVGELSFGIQKPFYEKSVVRPSGPLPVTKANPWLLNGALSVIVNDDLVFYAGYTKGLEESPVAPDIAVNRGEAPPAIITQQMDAGFRYKLPRHLASLPPSLTVLSPQAPRN